MYMFTPLTVLLWIGCEGTVTGRGTGVGEDGSSPAIYLTSYLPPSPRTPSVAPAYHHQALLPRPPALCQCLVQEECRQRQAWPQKRKTESHRRSEKGSCWRGVSTVRCILLVPTYSCGAQNRQVSNRSPAPMPQCLPSTFNITQDGPRLNQTTPLLDRPAQFAPHRVELQIYNLLSMHCDFSHTGVSQTLLGAKRAEVNPLTESTTSWELQYLWDIWEPGGELADHWTKHFKPAVHLANTELVPGPESST